MIDISLQDEILEVIQDNDLVDITIDKIGTMLPSYFNNNLKGEMACMILFYYFQGQEDGKKQMKK